jgi:hypothetical protein
VEAAALRHEQIVDIKDPQAGTLARQDLQAKITALIPCKKLENERQRIYQKELPETLLKSTHQLQRWYETTKNIIKYMTEDAKKRERHSMRDSRTYYTTTHVASQENSTPPPHHTQYTQ